MDTERQHRSSEAPAIRRIRDRDTHRATLVVWDRTAPCSHATYAGRRLPTRPDYRPPRPSLSTPFARSRKCQMPSAHAATLCRRSPYRQSGHRRRHGIHGDHTKLTVRKGDSPQRKKRLAPFGSPATRTAYAAHGAPSPQAGRRLESPAFQHAYPLVAIPGTLDPRACRLGDLRHERSNASFHHSLPAPARPGSPTTRSRAKAHPPPRPPAAIRHSPVASQTSGRRTPGRCTHTTEPPSPSSPRGPPRTARARISDTAA